MLSYSQLMSTQFTAGIHCNLFHNNIAVSVCKVYFLLSTHGICSTDLIGPSLPIFVCRVHTASHRLSKMHVHMYSTILNMYRYIYYNVYVSICYGICI